MIAKDDGGFAVRYYNKNWKSNMKWPHIISTEVNPYVVIFIDVQSKRKGKRYEEDEDKSETKQREISAQIYAELLGQTLFGNWVDNPGSITHQEVCCSYHITNIRHSRFMLDIQLSTFTIAVFQLRTFKSLCSMVSMSAIILQRMRGCPFLGQSHITVPLWLKESHFSN